ncbi:hypothetical protein [Caldilinea sp.]|uniref:hypothetical protein n=1 Tax=Caldilinea sp. TaxID=2293560 RepID=UPI002B658CA2|nr:hypothetical protein [Anaerolineales bacterium]HQY92833.1 hypothetical protein [Caldilinea sp.]HRA66317.1 hypothetical protein [Caldilinea sp.]
MNREIGRAGILIGSLLLVAGIPLLFVVQPGTAEYVITLFTVLIGIIFTLAMVLIVRMSQC